MLKLNLNASTNHILKEQILHLQQEHPATLNPFDAHSRKAPAPARLDGCLAPVTYCSEPQSRGIQSQRRRRNLHQSGMWPGRSWGAGKSGAWDIILADMPQEQQHA